MMFLELTLYLLIGLTGLFSIKIQSVTGCVKAVLFVIFWPFYLLLKYVQIVDEVKNSESASTEKMIVNTQKDV